MTEEGLFGENVSQLRFVSFDTETTGSGSSDSLVEVAAVAFDEEFEHRRFETLVKPPEAIPPAVIKIHGITDEMVAGAPQAAGALEKFFGFLGYVGTPRVLLAHNAGFDVAMIHGELRRLGAEGRRAVGTSSETGHGELVLDTCMLAKALLPELPHHRLESLALHFKVETGKLHRALTDARALHGVFLGLLGLAADRAAIGQGLTLEALVNLAGGYFVLNAPSADARARPFRLPPRLAAIEPLCGGASRVSITYERDEDCRYITPIAIKMRGFRVYVEAFCHRENIKKTFRADRILKIGRVECSP
ncbi:MAG: hypothetical protein HY075_03820 [Deltaproteobacteria bacterium]|nr:hypothetical protein [Deltaproteobacteria bacterium]